MKDELMKAYERSFRGKNAVAAWIDACFFALLAALASFFFSGKIANALLARVFAAASVFISVILVNDSVRKIRFHDHIAGLRAETGRLLFRERLLCMDRGDFVSAVIASACVRGDELFVFQKSEPICPDDIFEVMRSSGSKQCAVVSVSDLRNDAKELVSRPGFRCISFKAAESIPQLADRFSPTEEEIDDRIIEDSGRRKKERADIRLFLHPGRAAKYFALGGFLLAASFVSSRSLYLRLLASITLSAAAMIFMKGQIPRRPKKA